jgi:ribosome modulation factor
VGTKRASRRDDGKNLSLASIHGCIAAQARRGRNSCPHADGARRTAWLDGYEAGIKAMTDWGENSDFLDTCLAIHPHYQ